MNESREKTVQNDEDKSVQVASVAGGRSPISGDQVSLQFHMQ